VLAQERQELVRRGAAGDGEDRPAPLTNSLSQDIGDVVR
jgi:hypothetical protein